MGAYIKPPELMLVFGGALGATMLSMPMHTVTGAVNYIKKVLFAGHFSHRTHDHRVGAIRRNRPPRWCACP